MSARLDFIGSATLNLPRPRSALRPGIAANDTCAVARRAALLADWVNVAFIHFGIEPAILQPHVPFQLDLHDGTAYVSLVAFTQRRLRPAFGGRAAAVVARPVASHPFLNVRTYVRHEGERGIYFIAEWVNNRLAALVGPALYGLPYRIGRLQYRVRNEPAPAGEFASHDESPMTTGRTGRAGGTVRPATGLSGVVIARGGRLRFEGWADSAAPADASGELDRFLLERYTAFTRRGRRLRRFRIAHSSWQQTRAEVRLTDDTLVRRACPWWPQLRPAGAHYSPGLADVRIGPPVRVGLKQAVKLPVSQTSQAARRQQTAALRRALVRTAPLRWASAGRDWLPLLVLPSAALAARPLLPAWGFMWALALAIYFGCKWLTWRQAIHRLAALPAVRSLGYLFGWVGMDAAAFLDVARTPSRPRAGDWAGGWMKSIGGAAFLFVAARLVPPWLPLVRGWVGMIGLVLLLHFGTFHLLALLWRRVGVDAVPIMNHPTRAISLADFWGARWNRGFHQLAAGLCFRPIARRAGAMAGLVATFAASGLVHDLVISLPAGAGFGGPTAYFLIQGAGVCAERSAAGRRLGLGQGLVGRAFTVALTALPLALLFHRPFLTRVILPFMAATGAARH